MNSYTKSFTYLKHRDRYLKAARLRYLAKKIAEYPITLYVASQDAQEPYSPFAR